MKINKIKSKINSSNNISCSNKKIQNQQSFKNKIKSIIVKNSINNISNTKNEETIIPLTDNRLLYKKIYSIENIKKHLINKNDFTSICSNDSPLKNNSLKLMDLQNNQSKNIKLKNKFYHLKKKIKLFKIKLNNDISKNLKFSKTNKANIYLKFKKKISEFENEKKINKQKHNKSCINFKANYDSLFIDFFYKWNKFNISNIIDIRKIANNNYSNLIYNENQIFHYDYSEYIENKINEFKNYKIKNLEDKMESIFSDINNKEIKLKLYGIKLNFIPQNTENKINKNIVLYLPFTYSILFYYKGIDFFKNILLSIIHFDSTDYNKISIDYDEVNYCIENIILDNNLNNEFNKKNFFKFDDNNKIIRKKEKQNSYSNKKFDDNYNKKSNIKNSSEDIDFLAIFKKSNNSTNVKFDESTKDYKYSRKRNISIHSNSNQNNNIFYNSYNLIWETPNISYKLILEMPKVIFNYQDIPKNIISYCQKNMMLFLLKNNFINWDFYLMNYLFSIKVFRKIILNYFNNKSSLYKNVFNRNRNKNISCDNFFTNEKRSKKLNIDEINIDNILSKKNNLLKKLNSIYLDKYFNKKFSPNCDEKQEIFYFFYTNTLNINSLIIIDSYKISIEYEKLNPYLTWNFFFNFNQMKYLNEIKKYEKLELFLPKIIETDFDKKNLSLDFTVFDDFDPKIFDYDKKEIITPYFLEEKKITNLWRSFRKHKTDMLLKIQNPIMKIEKYETKNNQLNSNEEIKKELKTEFLDELCLENMSFWPKKIINYVNEEHLIDNNNNKIIKKRLNKRAITFMVPQGRENKIKSLLNSRKK